MGAFLCILGMQAQGRWAMKTDQVLVLSKWLDWLASGVATWKETIILAQDCGLLQLFERCGQPTNYAQWHKSFHHLQSL